MRLLIRLLCAFFAISSVVFLSACGGGGTAPTASSSAPQATFNQIPVTVEQFNSNNPYPNRPYVTVTVCDGAGNCQSIDHVLLDTGSTGLRLMPGVLDLQLPAQDNPTGGVAAECAQFGAGYFWGAQRLATIRMAGDVATDISITVAGDASIPAVPPTGCTATGPNVLTLPTEFKGILGIGQQQRDCGSFCAQSADGQLYFSCTGGASGSCTPSTMPLNQQTANPVSMFATDNNGTVLSFPAAAQPQATLTGTLTFGIGTQADNQISGQQVYRPVTDNVFWPSLGANIGGVASFAFLDSGTNAYLIAQTGTPPVLSSPPYLQAISGLAVCGQPGGPFCPSVPANVQVRLNGLTGDPSSMQNITLADPTMAFQQNQAVIPNLGFQNNFITSYAILGLPFFYGRSVMTAIDGMPTPYGMGPYWAF